MMLGSWDAIKPEKEKNPAGFWVSLQASKPPSLPAVPEAPASKHPSFPASQRCRRHPMSDLKPSEIVKELDKYIIGQHKAKRSVAVALRNR
jgi:hypothetical protein